MPVGTVRAMFPVLVMVTRRRHGVVHYGRPGAGGLTVTPDELAAPGSCQEQQAPADHAGSADPAVACGRGAGIRTAFASHRKRRRKAGRNWPGCLSLVGRVGTKPKARLSWERESRPGRRCWPTTSAFTDVALFGDSGRAGRPGSHADFLDEAAVLLQTSAWSGGGGGPLASRRKRWGRWPSRCCRMRSIRRETSELLLRRHDAFPAHNGAEMLAVARLDDAIVADVAADSPAGTQPQAAPEAHRVLPNTSAAVHDVEAAAVELMKGSDGLRGRSVPTTGAPGGSNTRWPNALKPSWDVGGLKRPILPFAIGPRSAGRRCRRSDAEARSWYAAQRVVEVVHQRGRDRALSTTHRLINACR